MIDDEEVTVGSNWRFAKGHVKGIMGDFGIVRRANGARQLTFNGRALYTYANEDAGQVLCNNVDSWFAVKVRG